jgi:cyclic beta-1,2-glucan synthetase
MKVKAHSVIEILSRLRQNFQVNIPIRTKVLEEPFRSELFSSDQMNRHGGSVALSHTLLKGKPSDQLLKRLDNNEEVLLEVRNLLAESIRSGKNITPGGEWLLDNFYLIEEQVVLARKHLPKGYSEALPYLAEGPSAHMPRVYDIVLEIISHSDGRVDIKSLSSFVASYQTSTVLTLGELWAIPIMLRLAVIENLRRVSGMIALDLIDQNLAEYWADRMLDTVKEAPGDLVLTIADLARSRPEFTAPFVASFTRKLQGKGPALAMPLSWMEQKLGAQGLSSQELVQQENQKQAADQVSVRNSIGTLRFLGANDWREFVETLSSVEQVLRQDLTGTYAHMDFATRDRYRHVVEGIAKRSPLSETEVAQQVLLLATKPENATQTFTRQEHVGYYLIDQGIKRTEQACGMRYTLKQSLARSARKMPVFLYLFSIAFLTLLVASGLFSLAYAYGPQDWRVLVPAGFLLLAGSAQLAVSVVNWLSTLWVKPRLLPRMNFSTGIPAEYRSLVVVPTMLSGEAYIEDMIEGLEIRFLANQEPHLHFGLLTDYMDADTETLPEDEALLQLASSRIRALNRKYNQAEHDTFFLFHRPRTWNPGEKKWMGYERKRGKLAALNGLLRGQGRGEFSQVTGNYRILTRVKYVITLDADTQLPREAAAKLIATMAHPLNKAIYDPQKKRVTAGYGILQPRVAASIPTGPKSFYLKLQGQVSGIDPYTRVSSDVYQDLFGEGSFIGKGIYDVDIFEQAVAEVFPENRILSHDLVEGCYCRSGLLSDVLLYEESPAQYGADLKRHHRWIRGDWQIGAWMMPFVTGSKGHLTPNRLSALSRWKIFDNLRRSLLPVSLLALLLMGWTVLPFPWFWTLTVTLVVLLAVIAAAGWQLLHKPKDITVRAHLTEVGQSVRDVLYRFVFGLAVLPYEAFAYSDAVIRTNWRMIFSGKKLLEWTPSADSSSRSRQSIHAFYRTMWVAPLLALGCTIYFLSQAPSTFLVATPFLILWLLAPALAWRLSLPETEKLPDLKEEQTLFLHQAARKTWSFFERFVRAEENWLPPDNFQEEPLAVIAHRTSPTNLGLSLLANLSAYDFGYIGGAELTVRTHQTLQTMLRLERYKGHFYNWYDTLSLQPLHPRYVSTVDTGNLAGHLLTLRQGLLSLPLQPLFSPVFYQGLSTTASIIQEASDGPNATIAAKIRAVADAAALEEKVSLLRVKERLEELLLLAEELTGHQPKSETGDLPWVSRLARQVKRMQDDLAHQIPWMDLLPLPQTWGPSFAADQLPTLLSLAQMPDPLPADLAGSGETNRQPEQREGFSLLQAAVALGSERAAERLLLLDHLAEQCEELSNVEYDFLFNKSTNLLRIGYNVEEQRNDDSFYDLLASEARLGLFVAIAQGKLPQESWFALGRLLTKSGGDPILLSWSGSMFEYLMPQLVMPVYENTLLDQTGKATVKRQIEYGWQRGIPWGISESGYNAFDAHLNYQYRAFGVPGLGLKRGLEEDLVIAPYASMLALMVLPDKACTNLQALDKEGFSGKNGFYEAIDYTPSRLPRGKTFSIVQSYMVHHQGMGLLSLAYLLLNKPMQQRFVMELRFQATLLLLQERIPRATIFYAHTADLIETHSETANVQVRTIPTANTPAPEIQLLSNGRYQVMVTNSGGGYSRWNDLAVTRWREDATKDDRGIFCYLKDVESGRFWSNTFQPTLQPATGYEATFSQGHVEFRRRDHGIDTKTEIVVSPEDDTELRRIKLTNTTSSLRVLEITSYAEIVMASQASDEAHPAFSNLFVQTEIMPEYNAVCCTRRPRSEEENPPWMFHHMDVHGAAVEAVSYETDRLQFTGRGQTLAHPQAMDQEALSGKQGAVLDPILSIRYRIRLKPGRTATVDLIYGISETKASCEGLMQKYRDQHLKKRALELSWTHSQVLLRQINATEADAQLYNRLASSVIYANPLLRAEAAVIRQNYRGQSGLWSHSVSGDLPIVLLHIYDSQSIELVRQMVQAHAYWRLKGLAVDLVIWNEDHGSYRQLLQDQILGLITTEALGKPVYNRPGQIYVKSADQLSAEDRILFESVARVIIHDNRGTLTEQINRHFPEKVLPPLLEQKPAAGQGQDLPALSLPEDLLFFNGIGGFSPDGKTYSILTDKRTTTPAPWVNVLANPDFGSVVSESGSSYTWAINAHEYRLTPWSNDPVSDVGGEAFYLRDEETGHFWSPAPFPVRGNSPYITTHGFGYSLFAHQAKGISSEMCVFVDQKAPVKFICLKIKNLSGRERKLSATGFMEIILGDVRSKTNMHLLAEQDPTTGALLFRNRYNSAFTERVTFFTVDQPKPGFTTDRAEFIGRNRNLRDPQALYRKRLSNQTGAGLDTCAALQTHFVLPAGAEQEVIFQLGNEASIEAALALVGRFGATQIVKESLAQVKAFWQEALGGVQVSTPDPALDILANGWLPYQTLACRIFARSGFYQSGGAFGFRDQLQDVLALLPTRPDLAREQIVRSASRQFEDGDVQHWWHPPEGRGVRTRCSDDMLWLPFVVSRYLTATGDSAILAVEAGYLESRRLNPEEDSLYDLPGSGNLSGTLYEHCVRAITFSLSFGIHGLPFIGSGDWNDGMDRVGHKGQGESVWLGFFLYDVLLRFAETAFGYGDLAFAQKCKTEAATLQANLEASGWDGEWYKRAFFDDGSPLGSHVNEECRIDAIAQSWSVLSGAAPAQRRTTAMASLNKHLVRRDLQLIQLLDPPFDKAGPNPGYIKGYVPGVRENGGQYSHAAIWTLMAFAGLREREKVYELFSMVNPINHAADAAAVQVYKVEPYVMAADVYANESHRGRGGWTWYTGSSGWMYQFIIGSLLGMELLQDRLRFRPCFPADWPSVRIDYRFGSSTYRITVFQTENERGSWWKTEEAQGEGDTIPLVDNGQVQEVEVHVSALQLSLNPLGQD